MRRKISKVMKEVTRRLKYYEAHREENEKKELKEKYMARGALRILKSLEVHFYESDEQWSKIDVLNYLNSKIDDYEDREQMCSNIYPERYRLQGVLKALNSVKKAVREGE